jgi:hypothetical protein
VRKACELPKQTPIGVTVAVGELLRTARDGACAPGGELLVHYVDFLAICHTAETLRNHRTWPNSDF